MGIVKPVIVTARAALISGLVLVGVAAACASASAQPGKARKHAPAKAALHLVPADTALVLSIDVAKSKRGPLFPRVLRLLELSEELARGLELLRAGADIDVRRNVTRVVVAVSATFPKSEELVYLLDGTFDAAKLAAFAKRDAKAATALSHRGVSYYRLGGKAEVALLGTRLMVARKNRGKSVIDLFLARKKSIKRDKKLVAAVRGVDRSAVVWAAFAPPDKLRARVAAKLGGHAVDSIGLSLTVKSNLRLVLELAAQTAASATSIASMMKAGLPLLAKKPQAVKLGMVAALSGAKVSRARNAVTLSIALDARAMLGLQALIAH